MKPLLDYLNEQVTEILKSIIDLEMTIALARIDRQQRFSADKNVILAQMRS